MYTKEQFSLPSVDAMGDFVRERSFGVLATFHAGRIHTSPLPLDLREGPDGELFVAGHVARVNEMSEVFQYNPPATITVLGPGTYVPAEWFGVRTRIPTWLYCAVELSGRLELSDAACKRADVIVMMDRLQRVARPDSTWTLDELPRELTDGFLKAIVGFRLRDLTWKSCFRLNQRKGGTDALAESLRIEAQESSEALAHMVVDPPTVCVE